MNRVFIRTCIGICKSTIFRKYICIKKEILFKKRFHIPIDDELEKGLDSMCNLGFQQSCIKYKASLEALMNKTSWPLEEAMDAIAIPERYRPILYERFAEEEAYDKEHEGCSN